MHFEVKEKEHTGNLTDEGVREAEKLAGVESFYTAGNMEWPHLIDNSLKAHHLYKRDVNYVVEQGQVIIVDEFTGRMMEGRQWSDGLHQAVEAKEGVHDQGRDADAGHDHAAEFLQALQEARRHDRHGHDRGRRVLEDLQARRDDDPHQPAAEARQRTGRDLPHRARKVGRGRRGNREVHDTGRPILVGTVSIEKTEMLSDKLGQSASSTKCSTPSITSARPKSSPRPAARAAVTIATNMAGRGTDIILGGNPEYMAWDQLRHQIRDAPRRAQSRFGTS